MMSDSQTTTSPTVHDVTDRTSTELRRHVLVADARKRSRDALRVRLRGSGYHVTVARTGFETIVKTCCQMPDLVLLDESLGDTEIAETSRLLATCPVTAHIPVVRLGAGRRVPQRVLTRLQRAAL
jgi:CheY-like chemotaxis protein